MDANPSNFLTSSLPGARKGCSPLRCQDFGLNMRQVSTRARSERTHRAKRIWSSASTVKTDWTFHQLAPYIGRMKTSMARALVLRNSQAGDLIVDPFCGSGVVAL